MYKPEMDLEMFQLGVGVRPKMVIFCPYTCILGVQTLNGTKWPFSFKMFNPGEGGWGVVVVENPVIPLQIYPRSGHWSIYYLLLTCMFDT